MKVLRDSSLKLLINRKKIFLKRGPLFYCNIPPHELKIFIKIFRPRCDMCRGVVVLENLGYLRVRKEIELVLCEKCLKDYLEYVERGVKKAVAADK
ncbi:MAG: hypothetical protein QW680_12870 [Pyrobaculum sp.]